MFSLQMAFDGRLCHCRKIITPNTIFQKFAERPWLDARRPLKPGFLRRLSLPEGSSHLDILKDTIAAARGQLQGVNWASGSDM